MSIVQYIQYIQFPSGPSAKPSVCWSDISQTPNLCTFAFYEMETLHLRVAMKISVILIFHNSQSLNRKEYNMSL